MKEFCYNYFGVAGLALMLAVTVPASAQETKTEPSDAAAPTEDTPGTEQAKPTGLWERDTLTGDWNGARANLADNGVTLGLKLTNEVLDTPSGGIRRGGVYEQQLMFTGDIDFEKLANLAGGTAHVSAFRVDGRGPLANNVGNNMDSSNIELARQRQTRLWTLWYQQAASDNLWSVRAGQLSVDDEFFLSTTSSNLMNSTFVWNSLGFSNLPGGQPDRFDISNGPGYPLGAPGARLQFNPSDDISWLTAAFTHQPESIDHNGAQFRFDGNALVISELQYLQNQAKDATGLPVAYKIGAWYDTGSFNDPHVDSQGRSLASPLSNGLPKKHSGEWAIYGVADRTLWQSEDGQAFSVFLRGGLAPSSYNLVSGYVDGGIGYKGLIAGREADVLTVGFAYANVGSGYAAIDRDNNVPVRDYESLVELNYLVTLAPWWTVQPDLQYIIHPGLGGANPLPTAKANATIPNATVLGLRSTITF
jgi:porin